MTPHKAGDQARLTGLLLVRGAREVWGGAAGLVRGVTTSRFRAPLRLLIAPQDIRTADPTVAADIYAGYFVFGGAALNAHGNSPFELPPPSVGWAEALAEFGWLRHLRAADTSLARANARALVDDWIAHAGRPRAVPAWRPKVVARRLLAWLSQSPLILEGADPLFYRRFMRSLGRQTAFLHGAVDRGLGGDARLLAAIALAQVGLCAEGLERFGRRASRVLTHEIARQVLPDGGHISRAPGLLVDVLLDLLPMRQAYAARGVPVPPPLLNAIDRMMPMIRTFRHGDGTLALFNGMGVTRPEALATVLAYDDTRGRPLGNAPYSGYQRLEGGRALVILDAGPPPPLAFSGSAHAGTLAFEFSVGPQRVVVNCGSTPGQTAAREAARATAAHSTLVLADHSSSRFASGRRFRWLGTALYAGPRNVPVRREDGTEATIVETSHDGYLPQFGLIHHRALALARDGARLEGNDRLVSGPNAPAGRAPLTFAIRFHLHPSVRAVLIRSNTAALIAFATGEQWVFEAGGVPIAVEESILFATAEGPRRMEQLVLRGETAAETSVEWSLSRARDADSPGLDRL